MRELSAFAASPEPPHALLFTGLSGTGRSLLARYYAQALNCEATGGGLFADEVTAGRPCGQCRSCRLIESGAHPDIVTVTPGDTLCKPRSGDSSHAAHPASRDIRICQVRGITELASRFPFEARYRLIVIDPADRLTPDAPHALLKTLEEPPGHTIFALITSAPEALLETVISRCRRVEVRAVPRDEIEQALLDRGVDPGVASEAATAARGRPGRALEFAADPEKMADRGRLLEQAANIAAEGFAARLKVAEGMAERFRKDRSVVDRELDAWEAFWEERLRLAAKGQDPGETRAVLDSLRAIGRCREDLLANVVPRAAFELMLITFPRLRLDIPNQEETAAHA